jgi:hypothetical protein
MNIKLVSTIGDEPVGVDEVKVALNSYPSSDQDLYIGGLITAARMLAEFYNGRMQVLQQWDLALDHWPNSPVTGISAIPNPYFGFWPSDAYRLLAGIRPVSGIELAAPLVSVDQVTYKDINGTVTTLVANTDYVVDTWKEPGLICPAPNTNWPIVGLWPTSAIHVKFTAGRVPDAAAYLRKNPTAAPAPEVPRHIRQGIMLLACQWFIDRIPFDAIRNVAEVPYGITALFTSDKIWF